MASSLGATWSQQWVDMVFPFNTCIRNPGAATVSNTYLKQDHVMQIKELALATGVDVETIRYYEKQGLMPTHGV